MSHNNTKKALKTGRNIQIYDISLTIENIDLSQNRKRRLVTKSQDTLQAFEDHTKTVSSSGNRA